MFVIDTLSATAVMLVIDALSATVVLQIWLLSSFSLRSVVGT